MGSHSVQFSGDCLDPPVSTPAFLMSLEAVYPRCPPAQTNFPECIWDAGVRWGRRLFCFLKMKWASGLSHILWMGQQCVSSQHAFQRGLERCWLVREAEWWVYGESLYLTGEPGAHPGTSLILFLVLWDSATYLDFFDILIVYGFMCVKS